MVVSFLLILEFVWASVVLVPKEGATPRKKQVEQSAYAGEALEPEVSLRKQKRKERERAVQSNQKKKKKQALKTKEVVPEESEDLEAIYHQEKLLLDSTDLEPVYLPQELKNDRTPSSEDDSKNLKEAIQFYKDSGFIKIKVEKEVTQELLDRTKNYKGELFLAKPGLLKLEINEPQKSVLLLDDKNVYTIDYPVDEMQNKVQILRSEKPENLKSQGVLALLVGKKDLLELFEVQDIKNEESESIYKLKPKAKNMDVSDIEVHVNKKKKQFSKIIYTDEIGNRVTHSFKSHSVSSKPPKDFFVFKQPANSTITDL